MSRDRKGWTDPLTQKGWFLERACNCYGTYREEWRHNARDGWEIIILPDKTATRGPRFNVTFYRKARLTKPLTELSITLTTYEPIV